MLKKLGAAFCILVCLLFAFPFLGCAYDFSYVDINHIINPASGMPYSVIFDSESGRYINTTDHIVSATVISPSSMEGDSYSTAICAMGLKKAIDFIKLRLEDGKIHSAVLFTADKKLYVFGDVYLYRQGDKLDGFKKYELSGGEFMDEEISLASVEFASGSYTRYTEFAFFEGIEFEVYIFGEDKAAKKSARDQIMALIDEIDGQINAVKEGTDIFRLNSAVAGERLAIGEHTFTLLKKAKQLYEETEEAFNIAITPLSKLWNVDIDGISKYRAVGRQANWTFPEELPSLEQIELARTLTDLNALELEEVDGEFFAQKTLDGLQLDLGGMAKGYAVDKAAEILRQYEVLSAQLNMSGNIYELGHYYNRTERVVAPWNIGITDPENKHDLIKDFVLAIRVAGDVSIVTSGDYERFYSYGYKIQR